MAVSSSESGNVVTLSIEGRFDFSMHQDFLKAYKEFPKDEKQFVVDLSSTEYMDSSAMGMLLQLREYASQGRRLVLMNGSDAIKEILRIANFDKLFDVT